MPRRAVGGLLLALTLGCAARQASSHLPAELRTADELTRAGCYTCLRDAVELYERTLAVRPSLDSARDGPGQGRRPGGVAIRLFEATLLLTLRAKELGLPFEPWLERARAAAEELPATFDAATPLELAALVPREPSGLPPPASAKGSGAAGPGASRFVRDVVPAMAQWRKRVATTGLSDATKQYLDLTLACADRASRDGLEAAPPAPGAPFVRYRLATCGPTVTEDAGRLLADDARWSEAAWFEGRRVLGVSQDLTQAIAFLTIAANAFPESGAMLMSLAGAQLAAK